MLTRDGREMKMSIAIAKEALLTSKLNIELKKKLVSSYFWRIALYGSKIWTLRKLSENIRRALKCGAGG